MANKGIIKTWPFGGGILNVFASRKWEGVPHNNLGGKYNVHSSR